ncbi:helix-turn-helix domain-containing protein [Methylobacterium oxalidis]|uniref:HTH araC/xylS-type domain-containing protein n=1 Tax=Methylobacterium oxalidis TaxID=944322 RepID=A0A512J0C1_9HYPH|nr:AraC family transcriptional regulator [Methylobacterium oxalidis]GEP03411.1 hypothetical protein MOX02_14490 [Methylobacterium oxalidis]GJE30209.1 hypothetical protein LDDCCGHA_0372 [Methylobacterium oxalidis]GLS63384.1 hypothetical protein GCM10007888_17650 [Methylobacterium oxalidis]
MLSPNRLRINRFPDGTVTNGDLDVATQPSSLTDELRQDVQNAVTQQRCKAERVACLKMITHRTPGRRLRAEGTSYKQLVNEAQFGIAKRLLADTTMTMGQISVALAFSEPAAFTHAFRRWSGVTPSEWRQINRVGMPREEHHEDPRPLPVLQ